MVADLGDVEATAVAVKRSAEIAATSRADDLAPRALAEISAITSDENVRIIGPDGRTAHGSRPGTWHLAAAHTRCRHGNHDRAGGFRGAARLSDQIDHRVELWLEVHVICNNLSTHVASAVHRWLLARTVPYTVRAARPTLAGPDP